MDASGQVVEPLDEAALRQAAQSLLDAGCEAVVVHFLHSYANPAHELRAGEVLTEIWPNAYITLGHALLSESREFERGVTAAVNASVQPIIQLYVDRLVSELSDRGYKRDLLVMNGNGGMVSACSVAKEAAKTVMSGPASGVMAAAYTGRKAGQPNLITYDMGGTSTDVSLILNGEPGVSSEIEIEYAMPIHVPMVDVRTVGAGGGSIAHVDTAGLLQVGPESAGATPGPICYGRGGEKPTISDANRMVSLSLGHDPRDFALFAFGGAGPLHATALARELAIPKVLVPARPGITNALGCAVADLRHDFVNSLLKPLDEVDIDELHAVFERQISQGRHLIEQETVAVDEVHEMLSLDMQFVDRFVSADRPERTPQNSQRRSDGQASGLVRNRPSSDPDLLARPPADRCHYRGSRNCRTT